MLKKVILIFSFMFTIVGCGGGGENNNDNNQLPITPSTSRQADINEYNSKKIALASYNATGIAKDGNYGDMFYQRKISNSKKLLKRLSQEAKVISLKSIAYDSQKQCKDGGSYSVTKLADNQTEVKYSNCRIDGVTYNGYAKATKVNSSYAIVEFKKFKTQSSNESLTITKAIFKIDTALSTVKIENMYAIDKKNAQITTYLNYNTSYLFDKNANRGTLTFNGWIRNDCTKGYVYIKSTNELAFNFDSDTIDGSMLVSAKGNNLTLSFTGTTLRIYDNEGVENIVDISNIKYELEQECN